MASKAEATERVVIANNLGEGGSEGGSRITLGAGQRPKSNGEPPKCWQSDVYSSPEPKFGDQ